MLREYHAEITNQALEKNYSAAALAKIIEANLYQDRLRGQIGHDEYHFDNNAFEKSYAYIEEQRALVISSLQASDAISAWSAFGRLTHTAQDFYAHTNYIDLWLSSQSVDPLPTPSEVDPVDPELMNNHSLCSGKIYLPLEALTFVKFLKPLVMPLLPRDSHAWMNLDAPEQGFKFEYAMQAAVKRTVIEFEKTSAVFSQEICQLFLDK
jgi:hypothetical protein